MFNPKLIRQIRSYLFLVSLLCLVFNEVFAIYSWIESIKPPGKYCQKQELILCLTFIKRMLDFMQLKKILNIKNSYQSKRLGSCWENQGI